MQIFASDSSKRYSGTLSLANCSLGMLRRLLLAGAGGGLAERGETLPDAHPQAPGVAERSPWPADGCDAFVCFYLIHAKSARQSLSDCHKLSASDSRRPKRCVTGALGSLSPAIRSGLARGAVGDELLPSLSETQSPALKRGAGPSTAPRWLPALSAATWHRQHAVAAPHGATPQLAVLECAEHGPTLALHPPTGARHTQHAVAGSAPLPRG